MMGDFRNMKIFKEIKSMKIIDFYYIPMKNSIEFNEFYNF